MRVLLVAGIATAVVLGSSPSRVMASPITATATVTESGPCMGLGGLLERLCETVEGGAIKTKTTTQKTLERILDLGKRGELPIGELLKAWRDGIIEYADLSSCDPTTWRLDPFDLLMDISACRTKVEPYVSMLAGATVDEKIGLTAAQRALVQIAEAGKGKPISIADLIQASRDRILILIDTKLSACDPASWRASGTDLVTDINKCREAVQPYVSTLAGAAVEEKMGLIDCVEHPEMAGDIRCDWH